MLNKNKKNMKSKILILIIVSAFIISCNNKSKTIKIVPILESKSSTKLDTLKIPGEIKTLRVVLDNIVNIDIPKDFSKRSFEFASLIENYKYIRLETNRICLIGHIDKLISDLTFLFVLDRQHNQVLKFDDNGKFLCKFGLIGKGPREFLETYDMTLNKDKKEMSILDLKGRKILIYDYNGRYIKEVPLYYFYTEHEYMHDKVIFNTGLGYNDNLPAINFNQIVLAKEDQTPLYKGFAYTSKFRDHFNWASSKPLQKVNNDVYYHNILSDTIWQIKDSTCNAAYVVNFLGRKDIYGNSDRQNMTNEEFEKVRKGNYCKFDGIYTPSKDYVYLNISDETNRGLSVYYSKISKKIIGGMDTSHKVGEHIYDYVGHSPDFNIKDNLFVSVIQPAQLKSYVDYFSKMKITLLKNDQTVFKSIKELDNPILFLYTLKKF